MGIYSLKSPYLLIVYYIKNVKIVIRESKIREKNMAFFNIKRKEEELTPEQIDDQIKEVREQIKTFKSDISEIKVERANNVKSLNEKMALEKANHEKALKKLNDNKEQIIKKAKAEEKKQSVKLKLAQETHKKAKGKLSEAKTIANQKIVKQLKINKKDLEIRLAQIESEYNTSKEELQTEHNKNIDNIKSLIVFEENAIAEAQEEKAKMIEQYEEKLADLQAKRSRLDQNFEVSVETINRKHDEEINQINNETGDALSKQKNQLQQLQLELEAITEKRNKVRKEYVDEKAFLDKELETLISNNEIEIRNATKLNESLELEARQTQAQLDALTEKYKTEYAALQFLLNSLVDKIPEELKEVSDKNNVEREGKNKELADRAIELKKEFDQELRDKNSELENEINNIKLNIEKNTQSYEQILKDNEIRNENLIKDYQASLDTLTTEKENLVTEIRTLEAEYKDQIKSINRQINETKTSNKLYIEQLKSKYSSEVQDLIDSYESKRTNRINELKAELLEAKEVIRNTTTEFKQYKSDFEGRKQSLIAQNEKEIAELENKKKSLNTTIKSLNEEVDAKRESFANDIDEINKKIEGVKSGRILKLQELDEENRRKLNELQEKRDLEYAELLNENESRTNKLNAEAESKKKELEFKLQTAQNDFNNKKEQAEKDTLDIKNKYEAQINKVIDQQGDLIKQINTLKDNLTSSEELFKQELEHLTNNFNDNKSKLEKDHNDKINEIIKQYEEIPSLEIESLKAQLEEAKANYANLNVELLEKKNQMQFDYDTKKSELQARQDEISKEIDKKNDLLKELTDEKEQEYKSQIYRLNEKKDQLDALKNEIKEETEKVQAIHNENLARITEDYNAKYNETVSKFNEEEMILRERLEGEIQYVTRDYDRKKADLDVQLNEVNIRKDQIESELKSRYNTELEKNRAIENDVRLLQEDLNYKKISFDAQIENKKKMFEDETTKFKDKQNEDLLAQKAHYSDILAGLQVQKEQLSKEIDLLAYEYNDKAKAVEEIRQTQNKDLSLLRIQLTQLIEQFNKNDVFGEKQAKLELMYDRRIAEVKKDFTAIVDEFDNLQATREGVGNITKGNELEITRKTEEFKRILNSLDEKHTQTIAELKNQYEATLKQISDDFKLYIQGNKNAINDCENEIISLQATYDGLIKEEEAKFVKLDAEKTLHNRQIEMIQKQFEAKIKQIDDNYSEISDEDKIKAQYAFESERRSYENQIESLRSEIDKIEQPKPSLNLKLRDLAKQKDELENDMFDKKQKLIELLEEAFKKIAVNYRDRVELKKSQLKDYDIYNNNKINIFK